MESRKPFDIKPAVAGAPKQNPIVRLAQKLLSKVRSLFEPEEVEVTFKVEGKNVTYTYTKVPHKQVA